MNANLLSQETSPYLLQHQHNPVDWYPWCMEAFDAAHRDNKPVLLSIGYTACHWCHVMAHESFDNPAIAKIMNENFICIKVDREERPDLDAIYQQSLGLLGQQGGWPLTMFLTPNGNPFWGGTYFPPETRWGRAGFPDVLRGIARTFHQDYDRVAQNVGVLTKGLKALSEPRSGGVVTVTMLNKVPEHINQAIDQRYGGFHGAPKFPNCTMLEVLWRGYKRTGITPYRDSVLLTLERICQGGIYDHIGGGFARYATEETWLVPHFEKMLYDNAQLIELLCWAYQETANPLFKDRVHETVDWLLREMRGDGDAFTASLDADSEHEEGKFYVWSEAEIDAILGANAELFKNVYEVTAQGNWEGHTILNRSAGPYPLTDAAEETLKHCRARLLQARNQRIKPERDDKILADWNGMMISSLCLAASVFDRADWLEAAGDAWLFITQTMRIDENRLAHSWCRGKAHPGILDDYAALGRAALMLATVTQDQAYLAQGERWAETVDRHFLDPRGGYYMTADDTETLITRTKSISDAAVPSGNGAILSLFADLYYRTGKELYLKRAEDLICAFSGELERNFFPLGAYLNGVDLYLSAVQIVIIADTERCDLKPILKTIHQSSLMNKIVQVVADPAALSETHPAFGKPKNDKELVIYICRNQTCSAPITTHEELLENLAMSQ